MHFARLLSVDRPGRRDCSPCTALQEVSDPLPTHVLKDNVDVLAPFLVELMNWSVACAWRRAICFQVSLHHPDLNPDDSRSFRPISNVEPILLERLVTRQILDYLTSSNLLPKPTEPTTQQRRRFSKYWLTYCMRWTAAILYC